MDVVGPPPARARRRGRRGAALVLVVVLCAALLVAVGALLQGSLLASRATTATWHHAGAHCAARSALWSACDALGAGETGDTSGTTDGGWSPMSAADEDGDGFADFSPDALFRALGDGYFESRVRPEGDLVRLRGRGVHGGVLRTHEAYAVPRDLAAVRPFAYGLFSDGPLLVKANAVFDSYDSSVAAYADHATTLMSSGRRIKNQRSSLGSNASVELSTQGRVFGDVAAGPGHTLSLFGTSFVTGSTAAAPAPVAHPVPTWTVPDAADPSLRMGDLGVAYGDACTLPAGTRTIGPGTYVVSSLRLLTGATLRITGSRDDVVELFVTGGADPAAAPAVLLDSNSALEVDLDGPTVRVYSAGKLVTSSNSRLNSSGRPEQLLYASSYVSASAASATDVGVTLRSASTTSALIYAPGATLVHSSNAELFGGAVVGRATIEANAFFHQDEALDGWRLPLRLQPAWFTPVAVHEVP